MCSLRSSLSEIKICVMIGNIYIKKKSQNRRNTFSQHCIWGIFCCLFDVSEAYYKKKKSWMMFVGASLVSDVNLIKLGCNTIVSIFCFSSSKLLGFLGHAVSTQNAVIVVSDWWYLAALLEHTSTWFCILLPNVLVKISWHWPVSLILSCHPTDTSLSIADIQTHISILDFFSSLRFNNLY